MRTTKTYFFKVGDIECEIMFRALDDADDVRNLNSLELTFTWFNECRDMHPDIIDAMSKRVGRCSSSPRAGGRMLRMSRTSQKVTMTLKEEARSTSVSTSMVSMVSARRGSQFINTSGQIIIWLGNDLPPSLMGSDQSLSGWTLGLPPLQSSAN